MGRARKTKTGEPLNLNFRAEADLLAALDAEIERMNAKTKGMKLPRSQVAIILLWEALEARAKARGDK